MKLKKVLQNIFLLYLIACGFIVTAHVLFKLVVGRLYEVEIIFWVAIGVGAFIALSSLIFYSKRPITHNQFKKRLSIHAVIFAVGTALFYSTGIFQFDKAQHPVLEAAISFTIICIGYGVIAYLLSQYDKNRAVTQEMNAALQRYQSRKSRSKKAEEGKETTSEAAAETVN